MWDSLPHVWAWHAEILILAINALRMRGSLKDKDAVNVLLKTGKNLRVGCAENSVITYVGFSSTCLSMACGNLDTCHKCFKDERKFKRQRCSECSSEDKEKFKCTYWMCGEYCHNACGILFDMSEHGVRKSWYSGKLEYQLAKYNLARGMHALKRKGVELLPCLKKKNS